VQPEIGDPNHAFDQRTGRNFFRTPCAKPKPAQSAPPPPPPPPPPERGSAIPPPTRPLGGPYVGLGGSYFFEPDTQIGLASALVGYRLTPNIGVEVQGAIGVTKEKFDNGSTFKSSTGIDWSLYPTVAGYLPVGGGSDLFLHGGYGLTRFGSKATSFSGSSSTSFEDHDSVGTAILGGGADIGLGGNASLRLQYDRLFFDNGSEGNRAGISLVYHFGVAPPPPP
jgi:hypothetical protein